jgi:hypothetical protein
VVNLAPSMREGFRLISLLVFLRLSYSSFTFKELFSC